jgi:hypothetical protein
MMNDIKLIILIFIALQERLKKIEELVKTVSDFWQHAKTLIMVSHGFVREERQYAMIDFFNYPVGSTPFG